MAKSPSKPGSPTGEPSKKKWLELEDVLAAGYTGDDDDKPEQGSDLANIGSKVCRFHYDMVERVCDALISHGMSKELPFFQTRSDEYEGNRTTLREKATELVNGTLVDTTNPYWPKVSVEGLAKMLEEGRLHHAEDKSWAKEELQENPRSGRPQPRQR